MNRLTSAAALAFVTAAPAFAADPPARGHRGFREESRYPVRRRRAADDAEQRTFREEYYTSFDAFYNPSNGQVEKNAATVQGRVEPLFYFNKCMAETGMPLTYCM